MIDEVLKMIKGINAVVEERKSEIDNISQCFQIQESLTGLGHSIVDVDNHARREFKAQFIFLLKRESQQRQFFVFSDLMIVANTHWIVKHVVAMKGVEMQFSGKNVNTNKRRKSQMDLFEFSLKWGQNPKPEIFISDDQRQIIRFQEIIAGQLEKIKADEVIVEDEEAEAEEAEDDLDEEMIID